MTTVEAGTPVITDIVQLAFSFGNVLTPILDVYEKYHHLGTVSLAELTGITRANGIEGAQEVTDVLVERLERTFEAFESDAHPDGLPEASRQAAALPTPWLAPAARVDSRF